MAWMTLLTALFVMVAFVRLVPRRPNPMEFDRICPEVRYVTNMRDKGASSTKTLAPVLWGSVSFQYESNRLSMRRLILVDNHSYLTSLSQLLSTNCGRISDMNFGDALPA